MKLKNILSVFCCLVAMASCSMEDDVLNSPVKEIQSPNSEREAILNINLASTTLFTKSTEVANGDKETKLENCVLVLMEGDNVLSVRASNDIEAATGKVNNATFLTKVRSGLSLIAIVNVANPDDYLSVATRTALNKEVAVDPNSAACLVKQGESKIEFPTGFGSSSTKLTEENTLSVKINVSQLAAKIELNTFNITYASGIQKEKSVTLTSVSFDNINKKSYIFDEHELVNDSKTFTLDRGLSATGENVIGSSVYSYANTNGANPVKMTLTFRIDEEGSMHSETVTKTYVVNKTNGSGTSFEGEGSDNYVNPGYLYRINVNMTVNTHVIDTDVVCYTLDWEHNEVSVDMSEIKN